MCVLVSFVAAEVSTAKTIKVAAPAAMPTPQKIFEAKPPTAAMLRALASWPSQFDATNVLSTPESAPTGASASA